MSFFPEPQFLLPKSSPLPKHKCVEMTKIGAGKLPGVWPAPPIPQKAWLPQSEAQAGWLDFAGAAAPTPTALLDLLTGSPPLPGGLGPTEGGPWPGSLRCWPGLSTERCGNPSLPRRQAAAQARPHPCGVGDSRPSPSRTPAHRPAFAMLILAGFACLPSGPDCALSVERLLWIYVHIVGTLKKGICGQK